jgi:hypothetical protein
VLPPTGHDTVAYSVIAILIRSKNMGKAYTTLISEEEPEQEETKGEGNIPQPTPSPEAEASGNIVLSFG